MASARHWSERNWSPGLCARKTVEGARGLASAEKGIEALIRKASVGGDVAKHHRLGLRAPRRERGELAAAATVSAGAGGGLERNAGGGDEQGRGAGDLAAAPAKRLRPKP